MDDGGEIVPRELEQLMDALELAGGRVLLLDADRHQVVFDRGPDVFPSFRRFPVCAFAVTSPASLEDLAAPAITFSDVEYCADLSFAMNRMMQRAGRTS